MLLSERRLISSTLCALRRPTSLICFMRERLRLRRLRKHGLWDWFRSCPCGSRSSSGLATTPSLRWSGLAGISWSPGPTAFRRVVSSLAFSSRCVTADTTRTTRLCRTTSRQSAELSGSRSTTSIYSATTSWSRKSSGSTKNSLSWMRAMYELPIISNIKDILLYLFFN